MTAHQIFFLCLGPCACAYAALRGGAPERLVAAAMVCASLVTWVFIQLRPPTRGAYSVIEAGIALTDLALFLVVVVVAMFSARFWPMLMASMMGCGLFGHLTKPLGPDVLPRAYYIAVAFWSYPALLLLIAATWRHRTRLKRYGVDHGWVKDLPDRYRSGCPVEELPPPAPHG